MNAGHIKGWVGAELHRPECVLAHQSGLLLVPDWQGSGGFCTIDPAAPAGQQTRRYLAAASQAGTGSAAIPVPLRPNGIALEAGGSVLLAHMGDTAGGIYRLYPDGSADSVVTHAEGQPLPPVNFVVADTAGRLWITVSTRLTPRARDYRQNANSGFIAVAEPGESDARIVADHLGYTNECVIDEQHALVHVNETFGRRLSTFDLVEQHGKPTLINQRVKARFSAGTYPDGLALDSEGGLWITSIVSNRLIRVTPEGQCKLILEDSDQQHLQWTEEAYNNDILGRAHLDKAAGKQLQNVSNLAFGGNELKTLYLGNLLGSSIPYLNSDIQGMPMVHWDVPLGDLQP